MVKGNIQKLIVSTNPVKGQRYYCVIDLMKQSYEYTDSQNDQHRFNKITDQQMELIHTVLAEIILLDAQDYRGPISLDGMYWEFDLITDSSKMYEIEGINAIDEKVVQIVEKISIILQREFGAEALRKYLHD